MMADNPKWQPEKHRLIRQFNGNVISAYLSFDVVGDVVVEYLLLSLDSVSIVNVAIAKVSNGKEMVLSCQE